MPIICILLSVNVLNFLSKIQMHIVILWIAICNLKATDLQFDARLDYPSRFSQL